MTDVRAHPAYHHIYNASSDAIQNLAYFFLHDYAAKTNPWEYTEPLWREVKKWWDSDGCDDLFFLLKQDRLILCDLRSTAKQPIQILSGFQKDLYLFCDKYRSFSEIRQHYAEKDPGEIEALLDPFVDAGIMVQENNLYLSLAIPLEEYEIKGAALTKFCCVLSNYGQITGPDQFTVRLSGR